MEVKASEATFWCRKHLVSLLVAAVVRHPLLMRKLEVVRA